MDYGIVLRTLGFLLIGEAGFMLFPLAAAVTNAGPDTKAFVFTIALTALFGWGGLRFKAKRGLIRYREAFFIVVFGWLLASLFGSLPFIIAGVLPSPVDAFFETVSGFTTTGATIISDLELLPRGILYWRSLTHWLGGMGIILFTLALLPSLGLSTMRIFQAESPGPAPAKVLPRLDQTAKLLYGIYLALTLLQIMALKICGWPWFEAMTHAFSTMGTGGFSTRCGSMEAFASPGAEWITILFMFAASLNFSLYYHLLFGRARVLVRDSEVRFYTGLMAMVAIVITINVAPLYRGQAGKLIRDSLFQTVSMGSSTGFSTVNYGCWPQLSQLLLYLLMFMGGCAGSTSSALKQVRVILILKAVKRRLTRLIHPQAVIPIVLGESVVPEETVDDVLVFTLFYLILLLVAVMVLLAQGLDLVSGVSAAAAALWNLGRGFGSVDLTAIYTNFNWASKIFISICMLLGRLEIYPIVALLLPNFWRRA